MRPAVTAVLVGTLALAVAVGVGAVVVAGEPVRKGAGDGRLVLVSGRDDHGLLARPRVALHGRPGGRTAVARVADGTLARVVAAQGTWLRVRTVDKRRVQGWVDDFHLRSTVHLVGRAPSCRVRLGGQWLPAGAQAVVVDVRGVRARVRLVRSGRKGWVPRSAVRELPPGSGCSRPAAVRPDATGGGHRHGGGR